MLFISLFLHSSLHAKVYQFGKLQFELSSDFFPIKPELSGDESNRFKQYKNKKTPNSDIEITLGYETICGDISLLCFDFKDNLEAKKEEQPYFIKEGKSKSGLDYKIFSFHELDKEGKNLGKKLGYILCTDYFPFGKDTPVIISISLMNYAELSEKDLETVLKISETIILSDKPIRTKTVYGSNEYSFEIPNHWEKTIDIFTGDKDIYFSKSNYLNTEYNLITDRITYNNINQLYFKGTELEKFFKENQFFNISLRFSGLRFVSKKEIKSKFGIPVILLNYNSTINYNTLFDFKKSSTELLVHYILFPLSNKENSPYGVIGISTNRENDILLNTIIDSIRIKR